MPRIRTIKPDFFTSPDTAAVDFPVRIFYAALWCWADDFGIGETNLNGLLGHAFPDSDGFTAQDVRRFCADCAQHFDVTFYTVRGRHFFAIPSWEKHQKLEKREERRKYPSPDDPDATPDLRFQPRADSAPLLRTNSGAKSALEGEGEGEGELKEPPYPPDDEPSPDRVPARPTGSEKALTRFEGIPGQPSALARQVAVAYSESGPVPIQPKLLREVAGQIDSLLQANIAPDAIVLGLDAWTTSDSFSPKQIPNYVHKANNGRSSGNGVSKPTISALDHQAAGEALLAKVSTK